MGKVIKILGTRGVPAQHGGFETFAERLAVYLHERGWHVSVYCQQEGTGPLYEDDWQGIRRLHYPVSQSGPLGTMVFDFKCTLHALREPSLVLTLGYNTALFCFVKRLGKIVNIINMDGIEWHRQKWGRLAKAWFYLNEVGGCLLGNHLIADHPEIKRHLTRWAKPDKITMIPYGADKVAAADGGVLSGYGLEASCYAIVIARPEPENSILEIVAAFSQRPRGFHLAVLGKYDDANPYHQKVLASASDEVKFLGAIYDKPVLESLRFHARFYVHGHQVGGTNPSLVEALGAGNAVLAHDNRFNRWVAGEGALYFQDQTECAARLDELFAGDAGVARLRQAACQRHAALFTWQHVLADYETLLAGHLPQG